MKLRKQIAKRLQLAIKQDIMKKKEEAISMARTANVFARVEPEVKEQTWNSNVQCGRNVSETDCTPERNSF